MSVDMARESRVESGERREGEAIWRMGISLSDQRLREEEIRTEG